MKTDSKQNLYEKTNYIYRGIKSIRTFFSENIYPETSPKNTLLQSRAGDKHP